MMLQTRKRKPRRQNITMGDYNIENVDSFTYLGVKLCRDGSGRDQKTDTSSKQDVLLDPPTIKIKTYTGKQSFDYTRQTFVQFYAMGVKCEP